MSIISNVFPFKKIVILRVLVREDVVCLKEQLCDFFARLFSAFWTTSANHLSLTRNKAPTNVPHRYDFYLSSVIRNEKCLEM